MRPVLSCSVAKLALPMTRLSIMRPATLTVTGAAARASCSRPSYLSCRAAARASGTKSLGYATPVSRSLASLARRSAIKRFSSWAGAGVVEWSVMVGGSVVIADVVDFGRAEIFAIQVGEYAGGHVGGRRQLARGVEVLELGQRREAFRVAGADGGLHVGVDDAGGQRDDARAIGALFLLDHARVHVECRLGGAVHAPAGVRVAARAGGDVQHAAVGREVFDRGQEARGQQHDGRDVQIERRGDGRAVDQGVGAGDGMHGAGVVDQQIAAGVARQGGADACTSCERA
ncbi:hypothetical protein G6F68_012047 [Rhizopus microsporus]|nr:hypothetical protein G6F68_012047 [Rhizopus microsporus]